MSTYADLGWRWSDEHGDYYRYQLRQRAGTSTYDLIWGRRSLNSTSLGGPSVASAPIPEPPQPNPPPYYAAHSPQPAPSFPYAPSSQPPRQIATSQPFDQQQAIRADVIQHPNAPPYPHYTTVQQDPNSRTHHDSNGSTQGPQASTSTTAEPPAASATELPLRSSSNRITDDGPETSDLPTTYPTPDGRYEAILRPRNYFKKGRIFMVVWLERRGEPFASTPNEPVTPVVTSSSPVIPYHASIPPPEVLPTPTSSISTQMVHAKPRIFVVVRQKSRHCLCVPVYTYHRQATSKLGVNPEDHAPLIVEGSSVEYHENEEKEKLKKTLSMVLEDHKAQWSPMSRVNLGKVQSVEYNLKVRTIGRLTRDSTADLEVLFREAIGLGDEPLVSLG